LALPQHDDGCAAVVIDAHGRLFLVKHSYVGGWHSPGGGVETGETVLEALERELLEEGGITAAEPPVLHGVFFNSRVSRRDNIFLYVIRAFRQEGGPRHAYEIIDHGFFAPDALPEGTTRPTRRDLQSCSTARRCRRAVVICFNYGSLRA
jgi:8-oxo-dGTP pyrophosphatase MutT (NUDIX family)